MMANDLNSPLSGRVTSNFGGVGRHKSKIIFGTAMIALVPMLLTTFAASVTVGSGSLEFGQGSQQAVACDENVFVALGEEWHGAPTPQDSSAGYFRVRTITISNLDVESCAGKRLRVRLVDGTSTEIQIGSVPGATVFQVAIPGSVPTSNVTDSVALGLSYLSGTGQLISGAMAATAVLNVSGTSVYDGSSLTSQSADVTFYVDPTATQVNIDGQLVRRATVETVAASSSAQ
jgi:hypothetical protein